jgi:hypothetical protein
MSVSCNTNLHDPSHAALGPGRLRSSARKAVFNIAVTLDEMNTEVLGSRFPLAQCFSHFVDVSLGDGGQAYVMPTVRKSSNKQE